MGSTVGSVLDLTQMRYGYKRYQGGLPLDDRLFHFSFRFDESNDRQKYSVVYNMVQKPLLSLRTDLYEHLLQFRS